MRSIVWATAMVSAGAGILGTGCRDTSPPPAHFIDLGDEDRPLLPVAPAWHDPSIEKGTAEWVPFRAPGSAPADSGEKAAESKAGGDGDSARSDNAEIEAEIRTLLDDYNALADEGDIPEMLKFHLPAQRETVGPLLEQGARLVTDLRALKTGLEEKLPDQAERITTTFNALDEPGGMRLRVDSLEVASDTEVKGKLPAGGPMADIRFVVVEDEWFIEFPALPPREQLMAGIDAVQKVFTDAAAAIQADPANAEQVLTQLEAIAKMAEQMRGQPAAPAETEPGEAPATLPDDSEETPAQEPAPADDE